MQKLFFTPGPTQLHPQVNSFIQEALASSICSISHRTKEFEDLFALAKSELSKLLLLPPDYHLFFLSSGTEGWERSIQAAADKKSFHYVNGAFSKRFYETALELGKDASCLEKELGQGFQVSDIDPELDADLITVAINETSTGVACPAEFINELHSKHPQKLIAVDAVSAAPIPELDLSKVDFYFFSVQKFFCLPAGLGVMIISPRALKKAENLKRNGICIGSYHSVVSLTSFAKKNQTPTTPNVLGLYLLAQISQFFNQQGIHKLREETKLKAKLIYDFLDQAKTLKAFVKDTQFRSQTVITVEAGEKLSSCLEFLSKNSFIVGDGYGTLKKSQFRIANFSAHSIADVERLIELLRQLDS
jgi:phosphoserine aminotransferase